MAQLPPDRTVCLNLVLKMWCFFPTVFMFLCWVFILVLVAPLSVTAFKHSKSVFFLSGIVIAVFTSFSTLWGTVPVVNWSAHSTLPTNFSYRRKKYESHPCDLIFWSLCNKCPHQLCFYGNIYWILYLRWLPPHPQYLSYFKLMLQFLLKLSLGFWAKFIGWNSCWNNITDFFFLSSL